jgi:hypothetical protein
MNMYDVDYMQRWDKNRDIQCMGQYYRITEWTRHENGKLSGDTVYINHITNNCRKFIGYAEFYFYDYGGPWQ